MRFQRNGQKKVRMQVARSPGPAGICGIAIPLILLGGVPGCGTVEATRELIVEEGTSRELIAALGPTSAGPTWPDTRVLAFASVAVNEPQLSGVVVFGSPADSLTIRFRAIDSDGGSIVLAHARAAGWGHGQAAGSIQRIAGALSQTLGKPVHVRETSRGEDEIRNIVSALDHAVSTGVVEKSQGWHIFRQGHLPRLRYERER